MSEESRAERQSSHQLPIEAPPTVAVRIRRTIESLLSAYEADGAEGPDAYRAEPCYHPMADGKYLLSLAELVKTGLLSAASAGPRIAEAIVRLGQSAVPFGGRQGAWGLGFPWKGEPPELPYLITTAIVLNGLVACERVGVVSGPLNHLVEESTSVVRMWVRDMYTTQPGPPPVRIPFYSPKNPEPIYNAAAYGVSVLAELSDEDLQEHSAVLDWLWSRRIDGLGWPYSPTNNLVDLLHQAYLLNSLGSTRPVAELEKTVKETVGQFAGINGFADGLRWYPDGYPAQSSERLRIVRMHREGDVELLPQPAHLWSLGEFLVTLSGMIASGHGETWRPVASDVAEQVVARLGDTGNAQRTFPRHRMHAAHGLASYLGALRLQAGQIPGRGA